jgi:hypothetical protein
MGNIITKIYYQLTPQIVHLKNNDYIIVSYYVVKETYCEDTVFIQKYFSNDVTNNVAIEYETFISKLPFKIKKMIFDLDYNMSLIYKNLLLTQLPNHIEILELNLFADTKELFPYLNNLPISMKLLKIKQTSRAFCKQNVKHRLVIHTNDELQKNDLLVKNNIKLPFDCKIEFPVFTSNGNTTSENIVFHDSEKIYFKLKYINTSEPEKKFSKKNKKK